MQVLPGCCCVATWAARARGAWRCKELALRWPCMPLLLPRLADQQVAKPHGGGLAWHLCRWEFLVCLAYKDYNAGADHGGD